MAEENTHQFLGRRERELIAQIAALRGQLGPLEAELVQVQKMRSFLPGGANNSLTSGLADLVRPFAGIANQLGLTGNAAFDLGLIPQPPNARYVAMTIKELTIQALLDHFPKGGTAAEIRDFIRDAYGRVIEPSSLRPQMHRLKADAVLLHDPATDAWNLTKEKRLAYSMYDHPTSRAAMSELKDETPTDE